MASIGKVKAQRVVTAGTVFVNPAANICLSTFIVLSPVLIISRREMMKITSVSITAPSEVRG